MKYTSIIILFLCLFHAPIQAQYKFRAREHFDFHTLSHKQEKSKYTGLSNTITFGHERKAHHYYGLYFNPLLASKAELKESTSFYAKKIKLLTLGITAKNFYSWSGQFFSRAALGFSQLTSDRQTRKNGASLYVGGGYEWFFNKKYSLAPEVAYRWSRFEKDIDIDTLTFSLAFHIYKLP